MSATHTSQITRAEISEGVAQFYTLARAHPVLGPVFGAHVTDWNTHEDKITSFWAGALLRERGYDGNPMQKHLAAGNVKPSHFPVWLGLFDQVLEGTLPETNARHWSDLAHRIGESLSYGLVYAATKAAGEAPRFG